MEELPPAINQQPLADSEITPDLANLTQVTVGDATEHAYALVENHAPVDSPEVVATAIADLTKADLSHGDFMHVVGRLKKLGIPFDEKNIRRVLLLRRHRERVSRQRTAIARLTIASYQPQPFYDDSEASQHNRH